MLISLNQRQRSILTFLLDRDGPTTSGTLAARYGASLRTIRYDLEAVRGALKGTGLHLVAKPRTGVWVEGPPDRRRVLAGLLQQEGPAVLTPQERESRLVLELLVADEPLPVQGLSDRLGCSRSTLLRDLAPVERRLREWGLRLHRRHGQLFLTGDEQSRREALVRTMVDTTDPHRLLGALRGMTEGQSELPEHTLAEVGASLTDLAEVVDLTERTRSMKFTDESYVSLVVHLAVALQRLRKGQSVAMPRERLEELKRRPEWQTAAEMAAMLLSRTGVAFPDADLGYLTLHLAASRAQSREAATAPPQRQEPDLRTQAVVDLFIRRAGDWLGVDLSDDPLLRDGLLWHIQGLLTRQHLRMPATNPLLTEVRQQMEPVHAVAVRVVGEMRSELGGRVTEDEIAFLTVHLAAALERQGKLPRTRVLVVCSSGLGSAQLLAARLVRTFQEIQVVGVVSALESTEADRQQHADLVVTTVPLPKLPVPVVQVSPLLGPDEVERVRAALGRTAGAGAPPVSERAEAALVEELMGVIGAHAEVKDPEGLRRALSDQLITGRPPLELIEPILREVALLGIPIDPPARIGLAIHMHMALPRFRAGQFVREPDLERMRREHRSLFRAVAQGLAIFGRWHGVTIPPDEVVPIMRYILRPDRGGEPE